MKTLNIEPVAPLESLEAVASTAALEAFSLKSIGNRVADILPALAHSYRQYAYTHKSDKLDLTPPDINIVILQKALTGANYLDVVKLAVTVPQGHQGNFNEFLDVFGKAVDFTNGIKERMVNFNQLLSQLITSEQSRASTRDVSIATTKVEQERTIQKSALAAFSKPNSRAAAAPLGDVYRSLSEITLAASKTRDITARASRLNLAEINALIKDSVELLDELERRAMEGTIENLSAQAYKSLASSTLTMARDAEFHALVCYKAYEIKSSMEKTAKDLINALRY